MLKVDLKKWKKSLLYLKKVASPAVSDETSETSPCALCFLAAVCLPDNILYVGTFRRPPGASLLLKDTSSCSSARQWLYVFNWGENEYRTFSVVLLILTKKASSVSPACPLNSSSPLYCLKSAAEAKENLITSLDNYIKRLIYGYILVSTKTWIIETQQSISG